MLSNDPNTAGIDDYRYGSPHTATGAFEIRATNVSADCFHSLDDIEQRTGVSGRREALVILLEYYYRYPDNVLDWAGDQEQLGEGRTVRARSIHKRHRKILNDLSVELGGVSDSMSILTLCRYYQTDSQRVRNFAQRLRYE